MNYYKCQRKAEHSEIKCDGLMGYVILIEHSGHLTYSVPALKCVRCGDIIDGKILYNRLRSKYGCLPDPKKANRRR